MLKNAIKKIVPSGQRAKLVQAKGAVEAKVYQLPFVGKKIWQETINKLESKPSQVNIEVTSICNSKCIMCPRHQMRRTMQVMPWELYEKVVLESKQYGVKNFALNGYGEIFTAKKDYKKYINFLFEHIPDAKVTINTNASLMNEEAAHFLIEKKINTVHIDIDGATKETFEKVRVNLKYEMVVRNVKRLIEMRNGLGAMYPTVRVGIINQPETQHEIEDFIKQWTGVADYVAEDILVTRAGEVDVQYEHQVVKPCFLPWGEMNVFTSGEVSMCCDDWDGEHVMGNMNEQSLVEIWAGDKFKALRELHQQGRACENSVCEKCSWARPGPEWFRQHRYDK